MKKWTANAELSVITSSYIHRLDYADFDISSVLPYTDLYNKNLLLIYPEFMSFLSVWLEQLEFKSRIGEGHTDSSERISPA